jgi:anti-anti-sigma factor
MKTPKKNSGNEKISAQEKERFAIANPLTGESASDVERQLLEYLSAFDGPSLTLDLSRVPVIDSRGISVCVGLYKECVKKDISLLLEVNNEIAEDLRLVKLDRMFPMKETGK